jgi:hypothetical protein
MQQCWLAMRSRNSCQSHWSMEVDVPDGSIKSVALTMIDTTTTLSEIIPIKNEMYQHVAVQFKNVCLACYPRPIWCVHDPGSKFIGAHFQSTLVAYGIGHVPCTPKNPQSTAICKCMHSTVGHILCTLCRQALPQNLATMIKLVNYVLASVQYGLFMAVHRTLGISLVVHSCFNATCSYQFQSWPTKI